MNFDSSFLWREGVKENQNEFVKMGMSRKQRLRDNSPFLFQYLLLILDLGLLTYVVKVTNLIVKMSCFTLYFLY